MTSKRIIVCDSGLGGLNIAREFFRAGEECSSAQGEYEVIYFNAFPDPKVGYNDLPAPEDQEEVLRCALEGMKRFSPERCLIACNTLSIIYDRLKKYYTAPFPVEGIVTCAVQGMRDFLLKESPCAQLLILGTLTTVNSRVYEEGIVKSGVDPERIFSLAVPGLAKQLESGTETPEVCRLIEEAARKSAEILPQGADPSTPLALGLCCTHYGFAAERLKEAFQRHSTRKNIVILDPDQWMCPQEMRGKGKSFSYHSRIDFFPGSREHIQRYFAAEGLFCMAEALEKAKKDESLFTLKECYKKS